MTDEPASPFPAIDTAFSELVKVMARLRDPDGGCPWDLEQSFETIAPYTIEEAYEVADAIERGDTDGLRDELGDLLFQVVFHSRLAQEGGAFTVDDVLTAIVDKMVRRHPHVFDSADDRTADEQTEAWEEIKAQERALKGAAASDAHSALDGVALALPSLLRAEKLQKRAARTGFDWVEAEQIFDKLQEEVAEVREAIASADPDKIEDEIGDLLFVAANLARRVTVDPERALRRANAKFTRRFKAMEALAARNGVAFDALPLDQQEELWTAVKAAEISG